jgi:hypothetical protein
MFELTLREAILVAVSYSDIFSYPLTIEELIHFLPYKSKVSKVQILGIVQSLHLSVRGGFVLYSRSSKYIALRKKRNAIAQGKWSIVYNLLWVFRYMPTVRLVAVTGALSMNNVEKKDDIDLLVVAEGKSVWVTRFIVTVLFDVMGIRRKPNEHHVSNLFCLNMYMSSDTLKIPKEKRNFYIAHEIVQMVPVFDRGKTYDLFIRKNAWVKNFLPHAYRHAHTVNTMPGKSKNFIRSICFDMMIAAFTIFDTFFMSVQRMYMKARRTREVVERENIQFHPVDANDWVYKKLSILLRRKKIPLDKFFFSL